MTSIPQLAATLFTTLTSTATTLARELGLVQRERAMDGGQFVRTLVLGWFEPPTASRRALTTMAHDHLALLTPCRRRSGARGMGRRPAPCCAFTPGPPEYHELAAFLLGQLSLCAGLPAGSSMVQNGTPGCI
ncbi:MAG: hypothetical protein EOM24_33190 [Chloroflexia bacterium]|nr:hypothetical protein [Chloroflexia bacterium]